MELVVDTNILIASLVKAAKSRELICSPELILFAPEQIILESLNHKDEILDKSEINEFEFSELIAVLLSKLNIVPEGEFKSFIKEACKLVVHPEDAPFLALALKLDIPIWSNDPHFKQQSVVKVFSTEDLVEILEL